jgi:uncharacterized protein (TIGR02265 family)
VEQQITKGMYINNVLDHAEKIHGRDYRVALCQRLGLPKACSMLGNYPVTDLTRVMGAAAIDVFPGLSRERR